MIQFVIALGFLLAFPGLLTSSESSPTKSESMTSNERQHTGSIIWLSLKIDLLRAKRRKNIAYLADSSLQEIEVVEPGKSQAMYNNTHQPTSN